MSELSDVDKFAATPRGIVTGYYQALELARRIQSQRDDARSTIAQKTEQYYALVSERNDVIVAFETYREKHKDQSAEIARLKADNDELAARVCDECNGDGWNENRVEGRHACACMEEAEPYAQLKAENERLKNAILGLFRECTMFHKYWGKSSNQPAADKAIANALALTESPGVIHNDG